MNSTYATECLALVFDVASLFLQVLQIFTSLKAYEGEPPHTIFTEPTYYAYFVIHEN